MKAGLEAARTRARDLVERGAKLIAEGFERYHQEFLAVTRRAKQRFEARDWAGAQSDSRERLDLYDRVLNEVLGALRRELEGRFEDAALWSAMRAEHSRVVLGHPACEIAETFFNSLTRRVFRTVGVDPALEYLDFHFERIPGPLRGVPCRHFSAQPDLERAIGAMLQSYAFTVPFQDLARDTRHVAREVAMAWARGEVPHALEAIEVLEPVFFRRKGAYLVGRVRGGNRAMPLVLALVHEEPGVAVDAVLLDEADVSITFSFTRSYFLADVRHPADTIEFLRTLMPLKPVSELYTALGYHRHGKTEFYRDLQRHLARGGEKFRRSPGARGMVMEVFELPGFDAVFKVIRDTFPDPKRTTAAEVRRRYRLVFAHDRAGRLVDAQEFEGLAFPKSKFSSGLLAELLESAGRTVRLEGDRVVVGHLYAERRVRPLDLYLDEADPARSVAAALDYGQCIRDLASTGIFPGDLLLRNFGVTRHGRVVFYDYDELRLLSECSFREVPESSSWDDELSDEPWFYVGPEDVFPEELERFVPFKGAVRDAYLAAHQGLYEPRYWRELQDTQAAGGIVDIYPYGEDRRLPR